MKLNTTLFVVLSLLAIRTNAVTITGNATLENETDFSGISIEFVKKSPSAVDGMTTTDASGNYSIDVPIGIYDVYYTKEGFDTLYIHSDYLVFENEDLGTAELEATLTCDTVGGSVSGFWKNECYIVESDLHINSNSGFTIKPGVTVYMSPGTEIFCEGNFNALGTDTEPITFTSSLALPSKGDWNSIIFLDRGNKSFRMEHCNIEYAGSQYQSVATYGGTVEISNTTITNSANSGISVSGGNSEVYDNVLIGEAVSQSYGIYARKFGAWDIDGPYFENGTHDIHDNEIAQFGENIYTSGDDTTSIEVHHNILFNDFGGPYDISGTTFHNNIVYSNNGSYAGGGNYQNIRDNTYYTTNIKVGDFSFPSNFWFRNNHMTYCDVTFRDPDDPSDVQQIGFNNFYLTNIQAYDESRFPALFSLITTNNNGTACDVYFNIDEDPLFLSEDSSSTTFFEPAIESPNVMAGGNHNYQPDGSVIGARKPNISSAFITSIENSYSSFIYPTVSSDVINVDLETENYNYEIINSKGEIETDGFGEANTSIDIASLNTGIYFVRIDTGSKILNSSFIKN